MKSQPGDLCPPEGHGAIVELDVRHLGLGLRLSVGVAWQGVGDGLAESLLGGRCGAGDYVLSHSQCRSSSSYATYSKAHSAQAHRWHLLMVREREIYSKS